MTSDLLEENQDLRKQVEELKDEIATRNGKLAILISENERLKGIVLGNEVEISDLKKSCDETQELLDKQIEATYKLDKENAELKEELKDANEKVVHLACNQNKELERKINKEKELLKQFLSYEQIPRDCLNERYRKFLEEVEQFISEVEK